MLEHNERALWYGPVVEDAEAKAHVSPLITSKLARGHRTPRINLRGTVGHVGQLPYKNFGNEVMDSRRNYFGPNSHRNFEIDVGDASQALVSRLLLV